MTPYTTPQALKLLSRGIMTPFGCCVPAELETCHRVRQLHLDFDDQTVQKLMPRHSLVCIR